MAVDGANAEILAMREATEGGRVPMQSIRYAKTADTTLSRAGEAKSQVTSVQLSSTRQAH